jgi:hypothetical protein
MRLLLATCACALLAPAVIGAHHSFAAVYFEDQQITIEGDVVQFEFRAPHAWLHVRVRSEAGTGDVYAAEWSNPNRLTRDNITAETLKPGDVVRVSGSPSRDRALRRIHLKSVERPADGWKWRGGVRRAPATDTRRRK